MCADRHRVAIIGLGRLGQVYAGIYTSLPSVEIVAFVETHPERLKWIGDEYGVTALFPDTESLLREMVPDIAAVVTPNKHYAEPVIACAEAGVKGISTDKPRPASIDLGHTESYIFAGKLSQGESWKRSTPTP